MHESGFQKGRYFDEREFNMYLVCFGSLFNQHAAALVEGVIGGRVCIWLYDIYAHIFSQPVEGQDKGKICNVREISRNAEETDEAAVEELYNDPKFKPIYLTGYTVFATHFMKAREWFVKDQIRTATGIAQVFLEAESRKGMRDHPKRYSYFVSQDELMSVRRSATDDQGLVIEETHPFRPQTLGIYPATLFLNVCSIIAEYLNPESSADSDNLYDQQLAAAAFLKTVNSCKQFLRLNLDKMNASGYIRSESVTPLKNFSLTGPCHLWDTRRGSIRAAVEPVNCTRWTKDFFEAAGIVIQNPSDKPKKAAQYR